MTKCHEKSGGLDIDNDAMYFDEDWLFVVETYVDPDSVRVAAQRRHSAVGASLAAHGPPPPPFERESIAPRSMLAKSPQ